jgi:hypothetical protein
VLGASPPDGVKVAVKPSADRATVPVTGVRLAPAVTVKVVVLIVKGSIATLNSAEIITLVATPEARSRGTVETTVGDSVVLGPVVKLQTLSAAIALPLRSFTSVVSVVVNVVMAARSLVGLKIAVKPSAARDTVPVTGVKAGPVTVKVVGVIVEASILLLKVAVIFESTATPVARSAGTEELTVGGKELPPPELLDPPHPAIRTTRRNTTNHILEYPLQVPACVFSLRRFKSDKPLVATLILSFIYASCFYICSRTLIRINLLNSCKDPHFAGFHWIA